MVAKVSKTYLTICLGSNLLSSIFIVILVKWIYTHYGFPNLTLTCLHFLFTTAGVTLCKCMGIFQPKSLPLLDMLPLSMTFCGFVVFTNLSLETNSVGTYQMAKTLTTPLIIVIQTYFYNKQFTTKIKLTLIPIILGVLMNSFYDMQFSLSGMIFASCGVVVTSLYQVLIGEKQSQLQCDSLQLLYYQAPLSASILFLIIPFTEPVFGEHGFFSPWSYEVVIVVFLSGIVAFTVNLSIFWIIGNTSPLSYNMVGHLKFCCTMLAGYLLFHDQLNNLQICGTLIAFLGIILYSVLSLTTDIRIKPPTSKSHKE